MTPFTIRINVKSSWDNIAKLKNHISELISTPSSNYIEQRISQKDVFVWEDNTKDKTKDEVKKQENKEDKEDEENEENDDEDKEEQKMQDKIK